MTLKTVFFQNLTAYPWRCPSAYTNPTGLYGTGKLIIPHFPNSALYLSRKSPRAYLQTGSWYLILPSSSLCTPESRTSTLETGQAGLTPCYICYACDTFSCPLPHFKCHLLRKVFLHCYPILGYLPSFWGTLSLSV